MSTKKKILLGILVLVIGLVGFTSISYVLNMKEGKQRLDKMTAIANKFNPPSNWFLEDDTVRQPSWDCITGGCPGIHKNWRINPAIPIEDFDDVMKLVDPIKDNFTDITNCDPKVGDEVTRNCYFEGDINGITTTFVLRWSSDKKMYDKATLRLE